MAYIARLGSGERSTLNRRRVGIRNIHASGEKAEEQYEIPPKVVHEAVSIAYLASRQLTPHPTSTTIGTASG